MPLATPQCTGTPRGEINLKPAEIRERGVAVDLKGNIKPHSDAASGQAVGCEMPGC